MDSPTHSARSGEILFEDEIVVRRLETSGSIDRAPSRTLNLSIQLRRRASATTKELFVRITDSSDPLILYTCVVCEEDYSVLRQRQGLLVDFPAFPHKFVELVDTCRRENGKTSPRFVLMLQGSEQNDVTAALEVVELNVMRNLCHLSLKLEPASIHSKFAYVVDCCKSLKAEIASKERRAADVEHDLREQLRRTQDILERTSQESHQLREELQQQAAISSENQMRMMNQEKQKLLKMKSDADRKADRERRELEARMNHHINELQVKVNSLTAQNKEISAKTHRGDSTIKELKNKLTSTENHLQNCREELAHFKEQNSQRDQEYQAKVIRVRDLETRTAHLEGEIMNRDGSLTRLRDMVESLKQQKGSLEEVVEEKEQKLAKRESSIKLLYAEFQKSLDVIKKLQKVINEKHTESKIRGLALTKQDKVVNEQEKRVAELTDQLQEATSSISKLSTENERLQSDLQNTTTKLEEMEKTIATNQNIISWLQKQLNEMEIAEATVKRAPLTEAYIPSRGVNAQGSRLMPGNLPVLPTHSTPLSNTLGSFPTTSIGRSTTGFNTLSSVRHFGNIPVIPEEISPRGSEVSPQLKEVLSSQKENMEGLDPKYLEPTPPGAIPVHGLLRSNYRDSHPKAEGSETMKENKSAARSTTGPRRRNEGGTTRGGVRRGTGGRGENKKWVT